MRTHTRALLSGTLMITSTLITSIFSGDRLMAQGKSQGAAANPAAARTPASASPSSGSGSPSGGGSGLQGLSYTKDTWDTLKQVPKARDYGLHEKDMVFVCYKLSEGLNAATPFILTNTSIAGGPLVPRWTAHRYYWKGDVVTLPSVKGHYFKAQALVGRSGDKEPKPVNKIQGEETNDTGSLTWIDVGDRLPNPGGPPVPGWIANHDYRDGDPVTLSTVAGHYFQAEVRGDWSGDTEPKPKNKQKGEATEDTHSLTWIDMGDMASQGKHVCADATSSHPLLMNQKLVVAIEMTDIPEEVQKRFTILNFNVTSQPAAPINVTPVQPSITAGTATGLALAAAALRPPPRPPAPTIYYATWPSQIAGDTVNAINVNLVYTPVAPALPWKPQTFYPAGSTVISSSAPSGDENKIGHFYIALNGGISGAVAPTFSSAVVPVLTFPDPDKASGLTWKDLGPTPPPTGPTGTTLALWTSGATYGSGDVVIPPQIHQNGHYYRALTQQRSGAAPPSFSTCTHGETIRETDNLSWTDMGTTLPTPSPQGWMPGHMYKTAELVIPPSGMNNGHFYRANTSAHSSSNEPAFRVDGTAVEDSPNLSWKDMGPLVLVPAPAQWAANTAYAVGAQITPNPANGHYYQALGTGVSGPNSPAFPVDGTTVTESGGLVWIDSGSTLPTGAKLKRWVASTPFMVGDTIQDPSTLHYYTVIQAGISGPRDPLKFRIPPPESTTDEKITWQDLGTTLPVSISLGQPPADQTVSVINYTFPQAHALSYFSLTSGVVWSQVQTKTFAFAGPTTPAPSIPTFNPNSEIRRHCSVPIR